LNTLNSCEKYEETWYKEQNRSHIKRWS